MGCGNSKKPAKDPSGATPVSANPVKPTFTLDDRVKCKEDGKEGNIVSVKDGGEPSVLFDGEEQAREIASTSIETLVPAAKQVAEEKQQQPQQPEQKPQEPAQQSKFVVGDRVKCKEDGKRGTVLFVYDDGDPNVKIDGDDEARPRVAAWFDLVGTEPEEVEAHAPPLQDDKVADVAKAEEFEVAEATDDQVRTESCSLFKWW